jgi:hypothetical protein
VVLAIQDTTEFNLTHLPATEGLGRCTGGNERGFLMHSLLAVSPEGLPLGVLGMKTWARREATQGSAAQRKSRPIHEKESIKWTEGPAHLSAKSRCEHTQFIGVGDRESDVYELFAAPRPDEVDWLVRAAWNRCIRHPQRYLWQAVLDVTPSYGCQPRGVVPSAPHVRHCDTRAYVCDRLRHGPICPSWTSSPCTSSRTKRLPISGHSNGCCSPRCPRTHPGRHLSGCNGMHGAGRLRLGTGFSRAVAASRPASSARSNALFTLPPCPRSLPRHPLHHAAGTAGR